MCNENAGDIMSEDIERKANNYIRFGNRTWLYMHKHNMWSRPSFACDDRTTRGLVMTLMRLEIL